MNMRYFYDINTGDPNCIFIFLICLTACGSGEGTGIIEASIQANSDHNALI